METKSSGFWSSALIFTVKIIIFFLKPIAFVWKKLEPKNISTEKLAFMAFSLYFIIWFSYPAFLLLNHNGKYWSYSYTTFWSTVTVFTIQLFLSFFIFKRIKESTFKKLELDHSARLIIGLAVFVSIVFSLFSNFSFDFGTYKNDYTKVFAENKCEKLYSSAYENHIKRCKKVKTEALSLTDKTFEIEEVLRIGNTNLCTAKLVYRPEKMPAFFYEMEAGENLCSLSKNKFKLESVNIYYHPNNECLANKNQITKYIRELHDEPNNMYTCYIFEKIN